MKTIYEEIHGYEPKIEKQKSETYIKKYSRNLGARDRKTTEFFDMNWEAFAWAAILGFKHNKRKELDGEKVTHFKMSVINNNSSNTFYALILFTIAKEGYEILNEPRFLMKTIEEYANGGFEIIKTILSEKGENYFSYDDNFYDEVLSRV